jgi:hypothetical protein
MARVGTPRLRRRVASGYRILSGPGTDRRGVERWLERNVRPVFLSETEFRDLLSAADELLRMRRAIRGVWSRRS